VDSSEKIKGLSSLFREIQVNKDSAVVIALELKLCLVELCVEILKCVHKVIIKCNIALIDLVIRKHEHINKGHAVAFKTVYNIAVVLVVDGISRIKHLCHFIIKTHKLGELSGSKLIGKDITVHCLDICKTHYRVNFFIVTQTVYELAFTLIVACRDHKGSKICFAEVILYLLFSYLLVADTGGFKVTGSVAIGALIGENKAHNS